MRDFVDQIDPEIAAVLPSIPFMDLSDLAKARAERVALAAHNAVGQARNASVARHDHLLRADHRPDPLTVREYRPAGALDERLPCLLWAHGGGHVLGSLDQDDMMLEKLVADVGCAIFSVDWRRAPEHPYPAAIEDCFAALSWLQANSDDLALDRKRVAVGGTSSGGGLAAGVVLLARDRGALPICFQWLFYPMLDDRNDTGSSHRITHSSLWNRQSNLVAWHAYLANVNPVPIYAAPSRADDLSGLPPTYIGTGALDLFVDENVDYAQRLIRHGVTTELTIYPGAVHGFDLFAPDASVSRRFIKDRTEALRRALWP